MNTHIFSNISNGWKQSKQQLLLTKWGKMGQKEKQKTKQLFPLALFSKQRTRRIPLIKLNDDEGKQVVHHWFFVKNSLLKNIIFIVAYMCPVKMMHFYVTRIR